MHLFTKTNIYAQRTLKNSKNSKKFQKTIEKLKKLCYNYKYKLKNDIDFSNTISNFYTNNYS